MNKLLLTLIIIAISTSVFGQQAFSSLEEQMKGQEFKAAGLDKLTPDELAAAEAYLRSPDLNRRQALNDLTWALVNTKEFLFRH